MTFTIVGGGGGKRSLSRKKAWLTYVHRRSCSHEDKLRNHACHNVQRLNLKKACDMPLLASQHWSVLSMSRKPMETIGGFFDLNLFPIYLSRMGPGSCSVVSMGEWDHH